MPDFSQLQQRLGHTFVNPDLLTEALTHRSYLNEHREYAGAHNERLEFLGDAVLELAATDFLFKKFPAKPEGELTSYRAALVNTVSLAATSQALGMNDYLLLSKGESKDTGRARDAPSARASSSYGVSTRRATWRMACQWRRTDCRGRLSMRLCTSR